MSDALIALHTAIAIIVIELLILVVRIDPQGALKALTLVTALASVVSLVLIVPLRLVV
ncbi:MAG TPA: hypothetical protein VI008_08565 [Rubrobacter sp.]|jgi:hypothetical protein